MEALALPEETIFETVVTNCVCGTAMGNKFISIYEEPGKEYCNVGDVICHGCGAIVSEKGTEPRNRKRQLEII